MKRTSKLFTAPLVNLTYVCVLWLAFFVPTKMVSQVGINTTSPDPSAMLDISATDKGVLIPRVSLTDVTSTMLDGTNTAATGLLIYNTNAAVTGGNGVGYYSFNGSTWEKMLTSASGTNRLADMDNDTKIQVEESVDEDKIRFDVAGIERIVMEENANGHFRMDIIDSKDNLFIGNEAGLNNGTGATTMFEGRYNLGLGVNTLRENTTGSYNVAIGPDVLINSTTGFRNVALGNSALYNNTTGSLNVALGNLALFTNTTGSFNVANGADALFRNTTGNSNAALGYHAMYNNTSGSANVATGRNALLSNTSGRSNLANGYNALLNNTTGNYNVANGSGALLNNTTGSWNVANGNSALLSNTTGISNVANGASALYNNTTGSINVANGTGALQNNTTGSRNVANGSGALHHNTTGTSNVANGADALGNNTTGNNNVANGINALRNNLTGNNNAANGSAALGDNTTGSYNVANGNNALQNNTTGSYNVALGYRAGYNEPGSNKLYIENSLANADNALIYGEFDTNILRVNGELQLGTTAVNRYFMPTARGTANQLMQTDGSGNLSWVDTPPIDEIVDADGDTKIQVEEGTDDDIIRFDIEGLEFQNFSKNPYDIFRIQMISNWGNILMGYNAGLEMRNGATFGQGFDNVGIGWRALERNTIGTGNVALGSRVLEDNISGNVNTSIGTRSSWENISGSSNVTIGYGAKWKNLSGNSNVAIGVNADLNNTSGNDNVIIGSGAGSGGGVHSKSGNVLIGNNAGHELTSSNKLYIENSSSSSPLIYGEFDNDILRANGEFQIGNPSVAGFAFPTVDGTVDQIMQTDGGGNLSWVDGTAIASSNTLDGAYDEGGPGAGNTINALDGAVTIAGEDGLVVTGSISSGELAPSGPGTKMFFNPRKAAFRAGNISGNLWDDSMLGGYSVAMGQNTVASAGNSFAFGNNSVASSVGAFALGYNVDATGEFSFAAGLQNIASGDRSVVFGSHNTAHSYYETVFGRNNSDYTPSSSTQWYSTDRLIVVGNGASQFDKGNALTIYKNGLMNINDEYNMPLTDGNANQIMQTDGSGNINWIDTPIGDITNVIAGTGLSGGGLSGAVTLDVNANNGITANANDIELGGTLNQNTTLNNSNFNFTHNLNGTGDFEIQDDGTSKFDVRDDGNTYFGGSTYWNANSTSGTQVARLINNTNSAIFQLFSGGSSQHLLQTTSTSIINEQGLAIDFRIEGDSQQNLFFVDGSTDRIGVRENTPNFDIHLKQSSNTEGGAGGIGFESNGSTNNWKVYHSGSFLSFAENGTRRAYVTSGTGAYVATSDRRLKKHITTVESILDKVNELRTYRYLYKDQDLSDKKTIGFMAQDVQPLFPELVEENEDGYLGLNYAGFGVVAIKAIQEQQTEINLLKEENKILKIKLEYQEKRLEKIEKLLQSKD